MVSRRYAEIVIDELMRERGIKNDKIRYLAVKRLIDELSVASAKKDIKDKASLSLFVAQRLIF